MATGIVDFNNAAGQRVIGGSARVNLFDENGNPLTYKQGDTIGANQRGVLIGAVNDSVYRPLRTDRFGGLAQAIHSPMFSPDFEGATLNPQQWIAASTTFVPAQAQGAYNFNSTNLATANAVSTLISLRRFKKMQRAPIQEKWRLRHQLVANSSADWGFGTPVGAAQIGQGAYFQITPSGVFQGVVTFGGTDVSLALQRPNGAGNTLYADFATGAYYTYDILMDDDEVRFTVQDTENETMLGEVSIRLPRNQLRLFLDSHPPTFIRLLNAAVAPASAPTLILTDVQVTILDANLAKPWAQTLVSGGFGSIQNPLTGAQLAQFGNSAAPTNAALSNTAAGYTTLGGLFAFATVAGAATDYGLFVFTNPSPYQLIVTGVAIDTYNDGAAVATTASNLIWGLGFNGSSANISSGFQRKSLGNQSFPLGAGIGATAQRLALQDTTPLGIVDAGRTLAVILRLPIGTATASQVIRGNVDFQGYFE